MDQKWWHCRLTCYIERFHGLRSRWKGGLDAPRKPVLGRWARKVAFGRIGLEPLGLNANLLRTWSITDLQRRATEPEEEAFTTIPEMVPSDSAEPTSGHHFLFGCRAKLAHGASH